MCGIIGFAGPGDSDDLRRMMALLAHRGPDGSGTYVCRDDNLHIGHTRLVVLDREGGKQPMISGDGDTVLSFNGEIYNHVALRRELVARGHRFASDHSDSEVLLHGWREWGEALPERLNGMFAFAIFDRRRRQLFLARDRFGEKPLYWSMQDGLFLFASEITAFTGHRAFEPTLDQRAMQKYFAYGYIPSPNAIYRNCQKLRPGAQLTFDVVSRSIRQHRYWQFRIEVADRPMEFEDARDQVGSLFRDAVDRRMMSDVPLGVMLSGGIDSSAVAATVRALPATHSVKSFCLGFDDPTYDESVHARQVADLLGTDHHEFSMSESAARQFLPTALRHLDEPMADPSFLPTMFLSGLTKQHVTVALTGDGGDELFGGYATFKALRFAALVRKALPTTTIRVLSRLVDLMPSSETYMSFDYKLRRALRGVQYSEEFWNPVWMAPLRRSDIADLFNTRVDPEDLYSEAIELWRTSNAPGRVNRSLEYYSNLYLSDDLLAKSDRASMRYGLELRSVFLDNDLVDFVRSLPAHYKYHQGRGKRVLNAAMERVLPDFVLNRTKQGFAPPLATWASGFSLDTGFSESMGFISSKAKACIDAHLDKRVDERLFIWAWLTLQHSPTRIATLQPA